MKEFGNFIHLSAGDLLREEMKTGSEDGKIIASLINDGKIVPTKITCGLLKKAMEKAGWEVNILFNPAEEGIHNRWISSQPRKC